MDQQDIREGLTANTVGRLISGFGEHPTSLHRDAITDPAEMIRICRVTFRPPPQGYRNQAILDLRRDLDQALRHAGVTVVPWEEAAAKFRQKGFLPIIHRPFYRTLQAVHSGIHVVIDVERPVSWVRRLGIVAMESLYRLTLAVSSASRDRSVISIGRSTIWADDHPAKYLQDHSKTQIVMLTEFDEQLVDVNLPYNRRIQLGLATLGHLFCQIVIGVHGTKVSVLNMNLTDSVVDRDKLDEFVRKCLVPKLFLPISPLLPSQFKVGHFDAQTSDSAGKLVALSKALGATGLLPQGDSLYQVIKRPSRRDIVKAIMAGRTGVSFGFIAYIEPPCYVGPPEISAAQWQDLSPSPVYSPEEIRRDAQNRFYARIQTNGNTRYRQIPDLWIASSRSGCDKTRLDRDRDILRIGYDGGLRVQLPNGTSLDEDLNPSYDIRVMIALALSAALYAPEMIAKGAPLFHFHGYPHRDWFAPREAYAGAQNPAVPCGTAEAGVFNFQALAQLAALHGPNLELVCFVEPDHGTNLLARDIDYLVARVEEGVAQGLLTLGGRYFETLTTKGAGRQTPTETADSQCV